MSLTIMIIIAACAATITLISSSLHLSLWDFSLRKLEDIASKNGGIAKLQSIIDHSEHYALSMGALRALSVAALIVSTTAAIYKTLDASPAVQTFVIALLVSAGLLYILAILLPASFADHLGEKLIHFFATPIKLVHIVMTPLRTLGVVDKGIERLAGEHTVTDQEEIEDELLSVVSEGERDGSLGETERSMIEAVVELRSGTAEEVMTPRTEMESLPVDAELERVRDFIAEVGHSRIPVYDGDQDHIVGILYAKDLLRFIGEETAEDVFNVRNVVREAMFVPEAKPLNELMLELRDKKVHIAIVCDEYGGTTGLITLEDIMEEIVGEIADEFEPDDEQPPAIVIRTDDNTAELEARAYIGDANDELEAVRMELPESEHYDTVGGFVLSQLGHIPVAGEQFRSNGYIITVVEAEPTRVHKIKIEHAPNDTLDEADANGETPSTVESKEHSATHSAE